MQKQLALDWITNLRSGKYIQNYNDFRKNNSFCALGVLMDLLKFNWETNEFVKNKEQYVNWIKSHSRLNLMSQITISGLNHTQSFNEIADYIEQNWENL